MTASRRSTLSATFGRAGRLERLDNLAELLETLIAEATADPGATPAPRLIGVRIPWRRRSLPDPADSSDHVVVRPLEGHPAEALRGFRAPPDWAALGVVAEGTARHLDDGTSGRASLGWVCERDGQGTSVLRMPGERPHRVRISRDPREHRGLVADVVRRALGLPSAPCTERVATLLDVAWLERIVQLAAAAPGTLSWDDAVVLHPVGDLLDRCEATALAYPGHIVHLCARIEQRWGWERVRHAVATDVIRLPGLSAETALWFDEGSFARAALAERPPAAQLLEAVDVLVAERVALQIRAALASTW